MKDEMLVVALFFILPPSSFRLAFLRDGVTGNTSGFELEDEGSTPSPAANPLNHSSRQGRNVCRPAQKKTPAPLGAKHVAPKGA